MVTLANGRGSRNHDVWRACSEIGNGIAVPPPVNLDLELSRDAAYVKRILDIPWINFVKVERTNSRRNSSGYRRARGGVGACRSFIACPEDASTWGKEVNARAVVGEGAAGVVGHKRIIQ